MSDTAQDRADYRLEAWAESNRDARPCDDYTPMSATGDVCAACLWDEAAHLDRLHALAMDEDAERSAPAAKPSEETMSDKLRECPFCGSKAELTPSKRIVYCINEKCDATITCGQDAWNRRSPRLAALERVSEAAKVPAGTHKAVCSCTLCVSLSALDNLTTDGGRKKP